MRLAEARLAASTMTSCSTMASLMEPPSHSAWVPTMKASQPLIDSP